jgi:hypothetical protein
VLHLDIQKGGAITGIFQSGQENIKMTSQIVKIQVMIISKPGSCYSIVSSYYSPIVTASLTYAEMEYDNIQTRLVTGSIIIARSNVRSLMLMTLKVQIYWIVVLG